MEKFLQKHLTDASKCAILQSESKRKRDNKMKKVNLWKSIYSGQVYEMPLDWMPQFDGWELIGTITKE